MSITLKISEDIYKKLQAALMLTGEDETTVLNNLITQYAHDAFERSMGKTNTAATSSITTAPVSANEQKQMFVSWFRSLTRNGKPYNPVTISGYTGRLENACSDPIFDSVNVDNLFAITDLAEFLEIQRQIKRCVKFEEFDAKSHNGFTAALRKYEEFLRFQKSGNAVPAPQPQQYNRASNVHRWTVEEDSICCRRFLECYVIQQSSMDMSQFLQLLAKEVPDVSEGSLRMKIQNIKYLAMQSGLKDTAAIKWLSQYSMQCERAFYKALNELNLR